MNKTPAEAEKNLPVRTERTRALKSNQYTRMKRNEIGLAQVQVDLFAK